MTEIVRIKTGVPGLDSVLGGGFLRGGVYVIEGSPGTGKTLLANQMAFFVAASGGRALYVTLLGESHDRMLLHLSGMGFFRPDFIPDRVTYLGGFRTLEADGIAGLGRLIQLELSKTEEKLIVIDGFLVAQRTAASEHEIRKFIQELQSLSAMHGSTVLILMNGDRGHAPRVEHTLVDGIVLLSATRTHLRTLRHLEVAKMRGSAPVTGRHTLEISDEGVTIHPRIEVHNLPPASDQPPEAARVGFGLPRFDRMLRGGLPAESISMVAGPSGSGKTILGLHFLAEGARLGERCLHFGFYEKPGTLLVKARRIHIDLQAAAERGDLSILWQPPVEGVLDLLVDRLLAEVRRHRPRRLFIDGIRAIYAADGGPSRLTDTFPAIVAELEAQHVTTLYTMEIDGLFNPTAQLPFGDVSAMSQSILLMRHVEVGARQRRLLTIVKMRDSAYDSASREVRITDEGIVIASTSRSAEQILNGVAHMRPEAATRASSSSLKRRVKGREG